LSWVTPSLTTGAHTALVVAPDAAVEARFDAIEADLKQYRSESNYLRVQDNTLGGTAAAVDVATPENMGNLVGTGENLLRQQVSRVNVDTGKYEVVPGERTNAQALADLARQLYEERTARLRQGKAVPGRGVGAAR